MLRRVLPGFKPGRRLVVLNDEAHHCYPPRAQGSRQRRGRCRLPKTSAHRRLVQRSASSVAALALVRSVYDLSATPYYLSGSGWPAYSYFPWVVSDFSLIEAIEAGLVKIPFLPVDDTAQTSKSRSCATCMSTANRICPKGQRTERKGSPGGEECEGAKARKSSVATVVEAPRSPVPVARSAGAVLSPLQAYDRGLRERGETSRDLPQRHRFSSSCAANTTVSKKVYKLIAGWTTGADGRPFAVPGVLPLFSNFDPVTRRRRRDRPPC